MILYKQLFQQLVVELLCKRREKYRIYSKKYALINLGLIYTERLHR